MNQPSRLRHLLIVSCAGLALVFAIAATSIATAALTPAQAQVSAQFQSALDSYGAWVRHPRWGEVWVPDDVPPGWRPYSRGHWIYTDEWGWYWVSDQEEEDWGWITYHYGRWAHDRRLGWFWIPGDEWGPAWVDWRRGDDYVGWAPLPPDEVIYEYDDVPAYWVFVPFRYLLALRVHRHFLPQRRWAFAMRNTVVINRTILVEHRRNGRARIAINAGISPAIVAAARRSPVPTYRVRPHVLTGTQGVVGAVAIRPQDVSRRRPGSRDHVFSPRIQRTDATIRPATRVAKPQPLGKNERGRLGTHPPRAAQGAVIAPSTAPAVAPRQRTTPTPAPTVRPPSPQVTPSPQVKQPRPAVKPPAPVVKPQRSVAPPPAQVKPQPKQPTVRPPSRATPQRPTPPRAPVLPQIKRQQSPAPRSTQRPAVRTAPRPPVVRQPQRPAPPRVVRPSAPPPQVRKPPSSPQVHRPPPVQRSAPAQAHKPPPKKPGEKDNKEKN